MLRYIFLAYFISHVSNSQDLDNSDLEVADEDGDDYSVSLMQAWSTLHSGGAGRQGTTRHASHLSKPTNLQQGDLVSHERVMPTRTRSQLAGDQGVGLGRIPLPTLASQGQHGAAKFNMAAGASSNSTLSGPVSKNSHPLSLLPASWLCLGPFRYRDYGTDPLRAFGSIQDVDRASRDHGDLWNGFHSRSSTFADALKTGLRYNDSLQRVSMMHTAIGSRTTDTSGLQLNLSSQRSFPNFPSETGPEGRTWWIMAYTNFSERTVPVDFKEALNSSGMNMTELNYQDSTTSGSGWAIGELNLTADTTLLMRCTDYFHIDDSPVYTPDLYGEHRSIQVVHLKKGPHRMYVQFSVPGFFCDVYEDSQSAREVVTGLSGAEFNTIKVSDTSDGTSPFIPMADVAVSYFVKGVLASPHFGVPVLNAASASLFLGHASIIDGPTALEVKSMETVPVLSGQIQILKLQLNHTGQIECSQESSVNFTVALYPKGEDNISFSPARISLSVPCREHGGIVAYPDFDGSIQMLWVEPPNITRFSNRKCPATGCPLMLSLHGSDVDLKPVWGDTYDYTGAQANRTNGFPYPAWLVQPTNRWRWGTDWEQQGFDNILSAVRYVEEVLPMAPGATVLDRKDCCGLDSRKTLVTGHSMGGHGCEVYSTHFPDKLLAVGCAAAWGSIQSYQGGVAPSLLIDDARHGIMYAVGSEHNADFLSANLRGIPMHAFYGSADDSVPTTENKLMAQLVSSASGNPHAVPQTESPGVGHWFEQNTPEMVQFFETALRPSETDGSVMLPQFPETFQFTVTSPLTYGSRGNLKLVEKVLASRPSQFFVERCLTGLQVTVRNPMCERTMQSLKTDPRGLKHGGDPLWVLRTSNVRRFVLDLAEGSVLGRAWPEALKVDGMLFEGLTANKTYHLCNQGGWYMCPNDKAPLFPAGPVDAGIRRAPVCIIHGSGTRHEAEALRLANKMYLISRYAVPIINAAAHVAKVEEGDCSLPYGCDSANLIFIGSPTENALTG